MTMSRRPFTVLVGVGDEETPDSALQYAAHVAAREGGVLRLVHVVPDRIGTSAQVSPLIDFDAMQLVGSELAEAAAERVEALGLDIVVQVDTLTGAPARALRRASRSVDLVVLQHRLLSRVHRLVTGSVAAAVARSCAVPVVSVPEFWVPWPDQGSRITVGLDAAADRHALLERAFDEATRDEALLDVVHAWHVPPAYDAGMATALAIPAWEGELFAELSAEVAKVSAKFPDVKVSVRVVRQRPADVLFEASRTASLLMVGRRRPKHLGPVVRTVLRESLCPVEIVPMS
jgi:nucleotide-binding universal stress UspA family protein